jgi:hypothetical protein
MKLHSLLHALKVRTLMTTPKFWPLDLDPEGQIYENVAWDLPGLRRRPSAKKTTKRLDGRAAGILVQ